MYVNSCENRLQTRQIHEFLKLTNFTVPSAKLRRPMRLALVLLAAILTLLIADIIEKGLWKYSRHPNYWGEILFWWGLYLYAIGISHYMLILAPISMTVMFLYVSIPWIEHKILRNRPQYNSYQERVNILIPEFGYLKKKFF